MLTAKAVYEKLKTHREPYLTVARKAAALTLVTYVPTYDQDNNQRRNTKERLAAPFQMVGAAGLNSLSSKITLSWLPQAATFVRLKAVDGALEDKEAKEVTAIEQDLLAIESVIMDQVEFRKVRPRFHEAVKQLLISGNSCLRLLPGKDMRVFPLSSYVTEWDEENNLLELIIEERVAWAALEEDLQDLLTEKDPRVRDANETVLLHTWVKRDGKKYKARQEIDGNGLIVPGSETTYPLDKLPYAPLRWSIDSGQPYGFGLVEEYMGALETLEGLTQSATEGTYAGVRLLFLADPNGLTNVEDLNNAPNGSFVSGNAEEIQALQTAKQADLAVAFQLIQELKRDLSRVFLLNSGVTRDAERVTAEEVRLLQLELDTALGGVFASLGQSFSTWLASVVMADLTKRKQIPALKDRVKPVIITGIEALGRGHEVNRISQGLGIVQGMGIPLDQAGIRIPEVTRKVFVGLGVETQEILQTKEEFEAAQEQRNTQQLVDSVGSDVIRAEAQQQGGEQ